MIIKYKLKENDLFQMQLYFFKADKLLKKIIIKNMIIWLIIFLVIILTLYFNNQIFGGILISIGAVISLILHPFRIKGIYFNRLKKENKLYENRFNKIIKLEIFDSQINVTGSESEWKIKSTEIQKIIETEQHYFIKFRPEVIIIPKSEIEDQLYVKNELTKLSEKQKIDIENQLNWKW